LYKKLFFDNWKTALTSVVVIILGLVTGFYMSLNVQEVPDPHVELPKEQFGEARSLSWPGLGKDDGRQRLVASAGPVVQPGTSLFRTVLYRDCGLVESTVEGVPEEWIGLSSVMLNQVLDDWHVVSLDASTLHILNRSRDDCPKGQGVTLGSRDGKLVVYQGNGLLLRETEFSLDRLLPSEREVLLEGIFFETEEEALKYLEGLGE